VPDLARCFVPNKEILVYENTRQLADIVANVSRDPEFALAVTTAGYQRVMNEHTFAHRAARMLADWLPQPAVAPHNPVDLTWAGTVSPSGPREWLANDRTMNLRFDCLHWQVHSHLIRRTVAENGPCLATAICAKATGLVAPPP
jgi:hypothetical protein